MTDGKKFVQRVDDRSLGQRLADDADRVISNEVGVLEVDQVGSLLLQEVAEVRGQQRFLPRGAEKPVPLIEVRR